MAIQYVTGPSGTGKTTYIFNKMINDSIKAEHTTNIFYISPEQANMSAEQDMVLLHPNGGTMDISIMSFTRLAFLVLDKENVYIRDVLDDYGKSMLLMKVLKHIESDLMFYKNMSGKKGFVEEVKSILSELYQYRITDEMLDGLLENLSQDKSIYYKIKDIRLIKKSFEESMGNSYMVAEQLLSVFSENIGESAILKDADIYFDGFTGFTPVQYEVIEELMKVCNNLYFVITTDENDSSELFSMGRDTIYCLNRLAQRNMITVSPKIIFNNNYRLGKSRELNYLERHIFRFPVKEYKPDTYKDDNSEFGIRIIESDDSNEEILCIGRMIQKYVREEGYSYRDIAVIAGDLEEQAYMWKHTMDKLDIPYFLDANEPLLHNPVSEITIMLFDIFEKDFSFDTVFSFLKTGFLRLNTDYVYALENYVLRTGIRGMISWNKEFQRKLIGTDYKKINAIREEFMSDMEILSKAFCQKRNIASDYIKALYAFMEKFNIQQYLEEVADTFEEHGNVSLARAYRNAYEKYVMVLDKTVDLLGDEMIEREVIRDVLVTGICEMKIGIIPPTIDQVIIGDMERTRLHHKKIVLFAGVNEGILPRISKNLSLLNDRDRMLLEKQEIVLAPDSRKEYYIQQFYLYLQLTQASEKVVLSYRKKDNKGKGLNISVFLKWIMRMFSFIKVYKASNLMDVILPSTVEDISSSFADMLSDDNLTDSSFYKVLMKRDRKSLEEILRGYLYLNQPGTINEIIAKRLYCHNFNSDQGESYEIIDSVSKLEKYSSCAYGFFLQYGLDINKREEYKVESNHIGTILHGVMEEFFRNYKSGTMPEDIVKEIRNITISKANKIDETIFKSSYRLEHQLEVLIRIANRCVMNLLRHMDKSDMKIEYLEKKFSTEDNLNYATIKLSKDVVMSLIGIIDRADIKETDDCVYVKIIDYKSGEKNIDFTKMLDGKQLQLPVYMSVIIELLKRRYPDKKIIPTGMFYFQLADKIIEGMNEEEADLNRINKNRLTGLFNSDEMCIEYMDGRSGEVLPVSYRIDGTMKNNKYSMTTEELYAVSAYTKEIIHEIGMKIICGQIDMLPQKGKYASPCQYCDFKSICRFEAGLGGNTYGTGSKLKFEEAKEIICGHKNREGDE